MLSSPEKCREAGRGFREGQSKKKSLKNKNSWRLSLLRGSQKWQVAGSSSALREAPGLCRSTFSTTVTESPFSEQKTWVPAKHQPRAAAWATASRCKSGTTGERRRRASRKAGDSAATPGGSPPNRGGEAQKEQPHCSCLCGELTQSQALALNKHRFLCLEIMLTPQELEL